jgi:mannose-1-phosphate guanylyltransferase
LQGLKAVILVGGPGTRLQPLTFNTPKSVVPVMNRPFMEHTIAYLRQFGIEDIILTLNYLPEAITSYFNDGSRCGVNLTYCLEQEPLGTAGAVKNTEAYLDDTFIVLNGDVFTDMDLSEMIARHRASKAIASISLSWVDNPGAFGVVETDDDRRVKRFIEKPPPGEETTNWINAGIYVLEPEVLEHIPANTHYMFERGLFPHLLEAGKAVYGYPFRGYWMDMGTPEKYFSLNTDLLTGKARSPLFQGHRQDSISHCANINLHPSAVVAPPVIIDDGCDVGPGVEIRGPAVIGKGCRLEEGVRIHNTVLLDNVRIEAGTRISHSIIDSNISVGSRRDITNAVVTNSKTVPLSL